MNRIFIKINVIILCISSIANAQEFTTLSTLFAENKANHQRLFNAEYYLNPANMINYNSIALSKVEIQYQKNKRNLYLQHEGNAYNRVDFIAKSYLPSHLSNTLWGEASYTNQQTDSVKWNNNIDYDKISPYVIADKKGGTTNLQKYKFSGGIAKQVDKFALGAELNYQAGLSYKTQDPRPKNISSDLELKVGSNYSFFTNYQIGLAVGINRYLQTTNIKFSSEVEQTPIYHINGLGTYHFYFSNNSRLASFTNLTHKYLFTFGTKDKSLGFTAEVSKGNLRKEVGNTGNSIYESNRLKSNKKSLSLMKVFRLTGKSYLGGKITYIDYYKNGKENFFTNESRTLQKLLEKDSYRFRENKISYNVLWQWLNNSSTWIVAPFYSLSKLKEKKINTNSYQFTHHNTYGAILYYDTSFQEKNNLSFQLSVSQQKLLDSSISIKEIQNIDIYNWLMHDYRYLSSNYNFYQSNIKYRRSLVGNQYIYAELSIALYDFGKGSKNHQSIIGFGYEF